MNQEVAHALQIGSLGMNTKIVIWNSLSGLSVIKI
jgi:hypothetical protein